MHHIRPLTLDEMQSIHTQYMKQDFPANELRPFRSIVTLYDQGRYLGIGLFDEAEQLLAYAYFASLDVDGRRHYLFDYLAVMPDRRDGGLGSEFLALLPTALKDADSVIGEVENPDLEPDDEKRRTKERRMQFYFRAGLLDTGVLSQLFDVDYRILELPLAGAHSPQEIASLYQAIYRSFLPEKAFQQRLKVQY